MATVTKSELAASNAALRAEISRLSEQLLDKEAHVRRLHLIIQKRYNAPASKRVERPSTRISFREATEIAKQFKNRFTVQEIMAGEHIEM